MGALTDKYCIVGVGETIHSRNSGKTQLGMACEAVNNAIADAGLRPEEIDGMTSYNVMGDSTTSNHIATALGIRLNYSVDVHGGGSSGEMLVANAIGLIEAGYAKTIVVWRSMNGRTFRRIGGQAVGGAAPVAQAVGGDIQFQAQWGFSTPSQRFGMTCMRHMRDYGTTSPQLGAIAMAHRYHATLNPKAIMKTPITIEDHQNSRWVSKPFHLLDCCQETDVAVALIVTSREQAYDLRQPPVYIMGGTARTMSDLPAWNYSRDRIHKVGGYYGRNRVFGMAGIQHKDVDFVSCYDAFTFTTLVQLEAYGFCGPGEGGPFVETGRLQIDRELPSNLSGGHLSEGYSHGIQMIVENARQLRWRADDFCPGGSEGEHTYDRSQGCRQLRNPYIAFGMGWGTENTSSSLVLRR